MSNVIGQIIVDLIRGGDHNITINQTFTGVKDSDLFRRTAKQNAAQQMRMLSISYGKQQKSCGEAHPRNLRWWCPKLDSDLLRLHFVVNIYLHFSLGYVGF